MKDGKKKPLSGRRILITRAREQAETFADLLTRRGAIVHQVPTIRFEPPESWDTLDRALDRLSTFGMTIFTSVNGVRGFLSRMGKRGIDLEGLKKPDLAAIGPRTAQALADRGFRVDLVPKDFVAEGLVELLQERDLNGMEILIPRAQEARDVLVIELEKRGAKVTVAPVYRTVTATENRDFLSRLFEEREVDLVTFTATSTVTHLANLVGPERFADLLGGVKIACIGPITAQAVRSWGLTPHIVPARYTIPDLAQAIETHFAEA